jgi:hypothetical protein
MTSGVRTEHRTGLALPFYRGEHKPCARRPPMSSPLPPLPARDEGRRRRTPVPLDGLKSRPGSLAHALFGADGWFLVPRWPWRALRSPCPPPRALVTYDRVRVAASSKSTAAGSSNRATARMNHRMASSSLVPMSVVK